MTAEDKAKAQSKATSEERQTVQLVAESMASILDVCDVTMQAQERALKTAQEEKEAVEKKAEDAKAAATTSPAPAPGNGTANASASTIEATSSIIGTATSTSNIEASAAERSMIEMMQEAINGASGGGATPAPTSTPAPTAGWSTTPASTSASTSSPAAAEGAPAAGPTVAPPKQMLAMLTVSMDQFGVQIMSLLAQVHEQGIVPSVANKSAAVAKEYHVLLHFLVTILLKNERVRKLVADKQESLFDSLTRYLRVVVPGGNALALDPFGMECPAFVAQCVLLLDVMLLRSQPPVSATLEAMDGDAAEKGVKEDAETAKDSDEKDESGAGTKDAGKSVVDVGTHAASTEPPPGLAPAMLEEALLVLVDMLKAQSRPLVLEQAVLQCIGHLLQDHTLGASFVHANGLEVLLRRNINTNAAGKTVSKPPSPSSERHVVAIIKRILEDPATLLSSMESEIRRAVTTLMQRENARGAVTPGVTTKSFLTAVSPLARRDAKIFAKACANTLEMVDVMLLRPSHGTHTPAKLVRLAAAGTTKVKGAAALQGAASGDGKKSKSPSSGKSPKSLSGGKKDLSKPLSEPEKGVVNMPKVASTIVTHLVETIVAQHQVVTSSPTSDYKDGKRGKKIDSLQQTREDRAAVEALTQSMSTLCDLCVSYPQCIVALLKANTSFHEMKTLLKLEIPHAIQGCENPPKSFVTFLLHCVLPRVANLVWFGEKVARAVLRLFSVLVCSGRSKADDGLSVQHQRRRVLTVLAAAIKVRFPCVLPRPSLQILAIHPTTIYL
jgi:hypothetical protein